MSRVRDETDTVLVRDTTPRDNTDTRVGAGAPPTKLSLLVLGDQHIATYPLPASG